jgi:hypothetical protein
MRFVAGWPVGGDDPDTKRCTEIDLRLAQPPAASYPGAAR